MRRFEPFTHSRFGMSDRTPRRIQKFQCFLFIRGVLADHIRQNRLNFVQSLNRFLRFHGVPFSSP